MLAIIRFRFRILIMRVSWTFLRFTIKTMDDDNWGVITSVLERYQIQLICLVKPRAGVPNAYLINNLTPLPLVMSCRINLDPVRQIEGPLTSFKAKLEALKGFGGDA